jgi:hypothetical protein
VYYKESGGTLCISQVSFVMHLRMAADAGFRLAAGACQTWCPGRVLTPSSVIMIVEWVEGFVLHMMAYGSLIVVNCIVAWRWQTDLMDTQDQAIQVSTIPKPGRC